MTISADAAGECHHRMIIHYRKINLARQSQEMEFMTSAQSRKSSQARKSNAENTCNDSSYDNNIAEDVALIVSTLLVTVTKISKPWANDVIALGACKNCSFEEAYLSKRWSSMILFIGW